MCYKEDGFSPYASLNPLGHFRDSEKRKKMDTKNEKKKNKPDKETKK